jgi:hypothetical protein
VGSDEPADYLDVRLQRATEIIEALSAIERWRPVIPHAYVYSLIAALTIGSCGQQQPTTFLYAVGGWWVLWYLIERADSEAHAAERAAAKSARPPLHGGPQSDGSRMDGQG